MPEAIAAFRAKAPDTSISMDVIARREVPTKMESQQFDIAIIALPFAYPDEGLIELGRYRGVCILPNSHELAGKQVIKLRDLARVDMVGLPNGTVGRTQIDQFFENAGLQYQPSLETSSAILGMVTAGLGAAIVDPFTALTAHPSKIAVRRLEPGIYYSYGMFLPVNRIPSAISKRMTDIVAETANKLGSGNVPDPGSVRSADN
jgi:DNA-binding transcriptional LysR family regulator